MRVVPDQPWLRLGALVLVWVSLLTAAWEHHWRGRGYEPDLDDTFELWAAQRRVLVDEPRRTALVGSSRMLFDIDLTVWEELTGERPVQLATVGTNPLAYLEDLARQPDFAGTTVVDVVPGLFFAPGGPPVENARRNLAQVATGSLADRSGQRLSELLERRLVFLNQDDLKLRALLQSLPLADRPGARVPPRLPPHFHQVDERRQGGMTARGATDVAFQREIQQVWLPLFTPPPFPPHLDEAAVAAMIERFARDTTSRARAAVEAIVARGGRVVFVRFPSTGGVRELERRFTPRAAYWDRLLRETGAPGVHFEDHEALRGFDCPEWSHLTRADATEFTRRLVPLVQAALSGR